MQMEKEFELQTKAEVAQRTKDTKSRLKTEIRSIHPPEIGEHAHRYLA